jgi:fumarate reductase flavoprotein subunit
MHKAMEESAGIYRNRDALESGVKNLRSLQERFADVALDDRSYTFNTELTAALELSYMLDLAEAIVHSALARRESRGSHQRTDFPQRNDKDFLTHALAFRSPDGSPRIDFTPVTITRWPPGQRVYGRPA